MSNSKIILIGALLLCLSPFLILCFYISPCGDDYSYAWVGANSDNLLKTLIGEWNTWNGRYLSNVLVLINPITVGSIGLYQKIPTFLLLLFIATHSFSISQFVAGHKLKSGIMSLCLLLIYLNVIPDLGEGIYWYTAAVTYFVPLLLFPLYLILVNNHFQKGKLLTLLGIIILQFALTGFNEILMIMMTLIHLVIAILKKNEITAWSLLLTQIVFSSLLFYAPGNEIRSSYFPNKHDITHTLLNGSANTLRFSASLLLTPSLWILLLLIVKNGVKLQTRTFSIWFWIIAFFLPQFIACAGPVWTTGIIGQHRTPNFALYFQIMVVVLFIVYESKHKLTLVLSYLAQSTSYSRLIIAFSISLLLFGNGYTAVKDLVSGEASAFHKENKHRVELVKSFQNFQDSVIVIDSFQHKPRSIFIYDIEEDPSHWKNEAYTIYYGLKQKNIAIRIKP